jgi:hypothetical protein
MSTAARQPVRGTTNTKCIRTGKDQGSSPRKITNSCAPPGKGLTDAPCIITPSTTARDVDSPPTEPTNALVHRTCFPTTPYKPDAWEAALRVADPLCCFSHIPAGFRNGFIINFPPISHVQIPPNKESISYYRKEFVKTLDKEITKNRYLGPFTTLLLSSLIGLFQSSPILIVPKPGCPGKFRVVQNFSYPLSPSPQLPYPLINSFINADDFPTAWGTFAIVQWLK